MRHGELIGLRWQDVDLVAGRITVGQNVVSGLVGTPKSGKPREIPLGDEVKAALKAHRHLRGPLVFCDLGGKRLTNSTSRHPLWRACKRAGLRQIGWHCLRHSFASHLVMRGATMTAVQELLGHATGRDDDALRPSRARGRPGNRAASGRRGQRMGRESKKRR